MVLAVPGFGLADNSFLVVVVYICIFSLYKYRTHVNSRYYLHLLLRTWSNSIFRVGLGGGRIQILVLVFECRVFGSVLIKFIKLHVVSNIVLCVARSLKFANASTLLLVVARHIPIPTSLNTKYRYKNGVI